MLKRKNQPSILGFLNPAKRLKSIPDPETIVQTILDKRLKSIPDPETIVQTILDSLIDKICCQNPASLVYTKQACDKLEEEIRLAGKKAIQNAKKKRDKGEMSNTNIGFYSAVERSFVTHLGHGIERVASVGAHVDCVGSLVNSKREKATDVRINLNTKILRIEMKTSSNTKCGTDLNHMVESCAANGAEGWWVVAFQKFGEKNQLHRKIFKQDDQKRRMDTVVFWKLCGIDYHELVKIWFRKDFIIEEMVEKNVNLK